MGLVKLGERKMNHKNLSWLCFMFCGVGYGNYFCDFSDNYFLDELIKQNIENPFIIYVFIFGIVFCGLDCLGEIKWD
jgi:hypothetical protein